MADEAGNSNLKIKWISNFETYQEENYSTRKVSAYITDLRQHNSPMNFKESQNFLLHKNGTEEKAEAQVMKIGQRTNRNAQSDNNA